MGNEGEEALDFQEYVNLTKAPCCVLRVYATEDGRFEKMNIICSNAIYKKIMGPKYYDGMPYYELVPKDIKFEDFCFRCAFGGKAMHTYVETKALNSWTDEQLVPLVSDEENIGYCMFTFEFTQSVDSDKMASLDKETAETVIRACVELMSGKDFRESVRNVLTDMLRTSKAFGCRLILIDRQNRTCETFCDVKSVKTDRFGIIPYEVVETWDSVIGVSNAVILQNDHDLDELAKENPEWAASLRDYNVQSLILVPMRRESETFGYLYITNFDTQNTVELKRLVEATSYFLSSELANHLILKRLEDISSTDPLTGLNNRFAMNRRFETLVNQPFGVISIDVNGLKTINDTEGHAEGDRLLCDAAKVMSGIFMKEDIYRTGGDEFLIFAVGISRERFWEKVELLRAAQDSRLSFAMGSFWSDGTMDLSAVILKTDESMYADKRSFYASHPERVRRG